MLQKLIYSGSPSHRPVVYITKLYVPCMTNTGFVYTVTSWAYFHKAILKKVRIRAEKSTSSLT